MKKIIGIVSVLFLLNIMFSRGGFASEEEISDKFEIEKNFKLEGRYSESASIDLTQYFSYNIKTGLKTKLNLPYAEMIVAVDDNFIVYGGVDGNIYSANRLSKEVKKIRYIGKGTYKRYDLMIWELKDEWMYYSYKRGEITEKIYCKTNIRTGESFILDLEYILYENFEKGFIDRKVFKRHEVILFDGLGCYLKYRKENKEGLLLVGWNRETTLIGEGEYIESLQVADEDIQLHIYDDREDVEYISLTAESYYYKSLTVIIFDRVDGNTFKLMNKDGVEILDDEDDRLDNMIKYTRAGIKDFFSYSNLVHEVEGNFREIYQKNIIQLYRRSSSYPTGNVEYEGVRFGDYVFGYVEEYGKDKVKRNLCYIDIKNKKIKIIEQNLGEIMYEYRRSFYNKDVLVCGDEIFYYREKKNQTSGFGMWDYELEDKENS